MESGFLPDIVQSPKPVTKKHIRRFLGTVNYYRKFVPNFCETQQILTPATSKETASKVVWTSQMEAAFVSMCNCLCECVSLCILTPKIALL